MRRLRAILLRFAGLFRNSQQSREFAEEIEGHLLAHIEDNLRLGMNAWEARRQALIKLGGMQQAKESYQQRGSLPLLETLWSDIRFAVRMLRKNMGFTVVAVATLALGIGGNTAIFSMVNGVLLNPLPFPQPDRLVTLHESKPNFEQGSISYPNFLDWQRDNRTFSSMAVSRRYAFSLTGRGEAEQVKAEFVTADFFPLLGVNPILGRTFTQSEEQPGAGPVALISEGLWRRKFGAAADVLGKSVTLDGKDFTIVGVIPAGFRLLTPSFHEQDVYAPIRQWTNPLLMKRSAGLGIHGIGRLKPGVTIAQARADMAEVTRNLATAFPDADHGISASILPLKEQMVGDARPFLLVLLAAVGFVLLIVCVNVAGLMMARSSARSREFAVRIALGASRQRVIRQVLTESILLGVVGGGIGLLLAAWGMHTALGLLPDAIPRAEEIGIDFRVLAFTVFVSLLAGILFGLAAGAEDVASRPSHSAQGWRPRREWKASGAKHLCRGRDGGCPGAADRRWTHGAQPDAALERRPGIQSAKRTELRIEPSPSMMDASPDRIRAAFREIDDRLASIPGVKAASQTWGAIPMGSDDENLFWLDGHAKPANENDMSWAVDYIVQPSYLKVMGIALERGRFFTPQDDEHSPPVAVIDDVFARKHFPNQDPIGKRIVLNNTGVKTEVVGIVGHVKQWGLDLDDTHSLRAQLYLPCMQMPDNFVAMAPSGSTVMLRYEGNLSAVLDSIRHTNRQMSSQQVIYGVQTMESLISDSLAARRFAMILLGAFAVLALVLANVGIYGVIAYIVGQRTQEIGIRMALGAQRNDVLCLVVWQGARLALMGVSIGIAGALALTRLMTKLLYGVSATDPLTFAGLALILTAVAIAACCLPARRAMRVDPVVALRYE